MTVHLWSGIKIIIIVNSITGAAAGTRRSRDDINIIIRSREGVRVLCAERVDGRRHILHHDI